MARKMVTGDAQQIVVNAKSTQQEVPCQGCGTLVMVMLPHKGDILCDECMKGKSYSLESKE